MSHWDPGHPYRFRTWLRTHLPDALLWAAPKGKDCDTVGGEHWWYNIDGATSGCYHCDVVRPGRLWEHGSNGDIASGGDGDARDQSR
jgi:hypothetical protein